MKKGLSILLVLSMLASMLVPFPVIASGIPARPPAAGGLVHTLGFVDTDGNVINQTVVGTGGVVSLGTWGEVLGGNVPTAGSNFDFVIDPFGLIDLSAGDVIDFEDRSNAIVFNPGVENGDVLVAYSTSSVPVLLTLDLNVTAANAYPVQTEAAVTAGNTAGSRQFLIWMEPNVVEQVCGNTEGDVFAASGSVIPFTVGANVIRFRLNEVAHRLVATGRVATTGGDTTNNRVLPVALEHVPGTPAKSGTSFRFGGIINTNPLVDWSNGGADNVEIRVNVVFTMSPASTLAANTDYFLAAGLLSDGTTSIFGLVATHTSYTAPTLIPIPGVEGGGNVLTPNPGGWIVTDINVAPRWVARYVSGDFVMLPAGSFMMYGGVVIVNAASGGFTPGRHVLYVAHGTADYARFTVNVP